MGYRHLLPGAYDPIDFLAVFHGYWLETRMEQQSPRGRAEDWRKQGFSGQTLW